MIAGTLTSLLGSFLYRYFGDTVFLSPRIISAEYYQSAKGAIADIFAFVGIIAVFAGIFAVIVTKVRFAVIYKPYMPDNVFAENVRYTGAAVVAYAVIFMKTAPEILSFGYVVPRSVYGIVFVAALTGVLLRYRRQLKKRGVALTKQVAAVALTVGGSGIIMSVAALIWRDGQAFTAAMGLSAIRYASGSGPMADVSAAAALLLTISDWLILAAPVILYIELLVRLRSK